MLWWFNHCINHNQRLWCSRHIPCLLGSPTTSMRFIPRVQDTVPLTVTTIQDGTWLHVGWQWPPFATARVAALNPLDLLTWVHSCILACPCPTKFLFSLTHSIQSGYPILEVRPKLWNAKFSKQKSVVSMDLQSDWETKILMHSTYLGITMWYPTMLIRGISLQPPLGVLYFFITTTVPFDVHSEILDCCLVIFRSTTSCFGVGWFLLFIMYNHINNNTCIPSFWVRWIRRALDCDFITNLTI